MLLQIQQWAVFVCKGMSCEIRPAQQMCTFSVFIFELPDNKTTYVLELPLRIRIWLKQFCVGLLKLSSARLKIKTQNN